MSVSWASVCRQYVIPDSYERNHMLATARPKLLLIEDDPLVRDTIHSSLDSQ